MTSTVSAVTSPRRNVLRVERQQRRRGLAPIWPSHSVDVGTWPPISSSSMKRDVVGQGNSANTSPAHRVNLLSPGPLETEMIVSAEGSQPGVLAMLADQTAQNRIAAVDEIVGPALYLASDASSYVTGDDLTVSGGTRK
jgi:hypothetical protein